ncbi:MAG: ABC transporter permease [Maritimibacter sp.]
MSGVAWRIAGRELRGGLRGFRVFLACLALGVAAIAAVGSVRASIEAGLASQGAVLLGGDAAVELTYRRATADELAVLNNVATRVGEVIDFRSMAVLPDESDRALTQLKAVDQYWPLFGAPELDPAMDIQTALAGQNGLPGAVLDPLLMARLEVGPGDVVRLGSQDFAVMAALTLEPDNANAGFALGPRTLVSIDGLAGSGLMREGTLFDAEYRLDLPAGSDLAAVEAEVKAALIGSGPRWRDARNGAPGISEFVERLGAFLVLVGLAGLAVGGVGISAAVRAYLNEKTETIATLKTLGAETRVIFAVYFYQIGVLTMIGVMLGLVIGALLPLLFGPLISAQLPIPADIGLRAAPLIEAGLYGVLAAGVFTLWPLARAEDIRAAALFRGAVEGHRRLPRARYMLLSAVLLVALIALAAVLSGVAKLALWTAGGLVLAFGLLVLAGIAVRQFARFVSKRQWMRGRPSLRMAFASVGGPGNEAASVVLSLGLGLTVLAAVGQIDTNLRGAIERDLPDIAPSFFVVDIQPDQIEAIRENITARSGVSRFDAAPMLRGVITRINGKPASEVAGDHWIVQGDRGVTYSASVPDRTEITQGEWWAEDYTGPPLISFVAEEAAEIGLELGDTMTVNILGRDITAEIASFRDVNFSTAGMGFTLAMNPAALAGAPHSWIATLYAQEDEEAEILRDLSRTYPNITVISVRDAIGQVTGLMGTIAAAITYGALITLVTGGVVLIGAAAAGERSRTYEAAVLKTLGASRAALLANFALRSAILGAAAGSVAVLCGGLAGWAVSKFVMDTAFMFAPVSAAIIIAGGVVLTTLAGLAFAWRPLAARPASVLRARE